MAKGSLHDHDPLHADEPPIMRGDAPPGMFTPRWEELQQTYGIERPRGASCEIFMDAPGSWDFPYANLGQTRRHA